MGASEPFPVSGTDPRRLDRLAFSLAWARHALTLPLSRCAKAFVHRKGWFDLGYARASDHARERLGRSGRWVRDLAELGESLARHPRLGKALCGDDGEAPIGRVAAAIIGRTASEKTLEEWIALARRLPVRELRERVAAALAGDDPKVPRNSEISQSEEDLPLEEDLVRVVLRVPRPLRAAFEEAHRLHEAVEGHPTDRISFVEALVGEATSTCGPQEPAPSVNGSLRGAWSREKLEKHLADVSRCWSSLESTVGAQETPEAWLATSVLRRVRFLWTCAGEGDAAELDAQLRALIVLENDLERALGGLLAHMGDQRSWGTLRFSGVGHYGEQRLGMSRASAESRAWMARVASRSKALGGRCSCSSTSTT